MADVVLRILLVLIGMFVGFGLGFIAACFGATGIVKAKRELEEELAKVKAERDDLKAKQTVKVIEIHDGTVGKDIKFGGF